MTGSHKIKVGRLKKKGLMDLITTQYFYQIQDEGGTTKAFKEGLKSYNTQKLRKIARQTGGF